MINNQNLGAQTTLKEKTHNLMEKQWTKELNRHFAKDDIQIFIQTGIFYLSIYSTPSPQN